MPARPAMPASVVWANPTAAISSIVASLIWRRRQSSASGVRARTVRRAVCGQGGLGLEAVC
jgi:hypothetical protein